ncbi:MAG TPA: DUF2938 domain-containing protein [Roseomonas sp.]|nr:DUF2938 domain-containing protein [Roseomonas sp.]
MVTEVTEIVVAAVLVGIGGTVILDLFSLLMGRFFGVPATNWRMVGRWIGHMPRGRFVQPDLKQADPVSGEHALGWIFHYVIGAGYGLLLVAIWGAGWLQTPSFAPPMILVLVLLVLPFFVMMPGMGMGIAGARAPNPNMTRLKSVIGHSVFGLGMYLTALTIAVDQSSLS